MTFFFGISIIINVDTSLNGDTVDIIFYEDADGDGVFENTDTFTVSEGFNSFTPTNMLLAPGNDVKWMVNAVDGDADVTTVTNDVTVSIEY